MRKKALLIVFVVYTLIIFVVLAFLATHVQKNPTINNIDRTSELEKEEKEEMFDISSLADVMLKYDDVGNFNEGLAAVIRNGKLGFINKNGEEVVPCKYDHDTNAVVVGTEFYEGMAAVSRNEKWGFINKKGEEIVSFKYDYAGGFSEGMAIVCYYDDYYGAELCKYGFINKEGKEVVPCKYREVWSFSEGLAAVANEKLGFINKQGDVVIPLNYDSYWLGTFYFSDGVAVVWKDGKVGAINKKGEVVVPFKYEQLDSDFYFSDGMAKVMIHNEEGDELWGFVNTKGKEVTPCKYYDVGDFHEGMAAVICNHKFGFINKNGEEIVSCKYDYAGVFSEGMAAVKLNGKWGFINKKGEEIVSLACKYDRVGDFHEGMAVVSYCEVVGGFYDGKWKESSYKSGFINKEGKEVVPCIYDRVDDFSEGLAAVKLNGKPGFVDKKGNSTFKEKDKDYKKQIRK